MKALWYYNAMSSLYIAPSHVAPASINNNS